MPWANAGALNARMAEANAKIDRDMNAPLLRSTTDYPSARSQTLSAATIADERSWLSRTGGNRLTESEDLRAIVHAVDEARRLLRAHVELSAEAEATLELLNELLAGQQFAQAFERTRLRSLRGSLVAPGASSLTT